MGLFITRVWPSVAPRRPGDGHHGGRRHCSTSASWLHDILRTLQSGIGAPIELYPYAIVLWILVEAYELMRLFYRTFEQVESLSDELTEANFELQETEAAIVRFVPFDFLRLLGKQSIRDVHAGDHARSRMTVLQCGFHSSAKSLDRTTPRMISSSSTTLAGRLEELHRPPWWFRERVSRRRLPGLLPGRWRGSHRGRGRDPAEAATPSDASAATSGSESTPALGCSARSAAAIIC